jgi:UDP-N-acetylmuramate: L-alanyl-gamma-D-glutamyl-meso-diaminopimelate ligase
MKIHIIAIGGAVMHQLAIALQQAGHIVSGSDDEIFNPAKENLEKYNLLPCEIGFFADRITPDIDLIISGMHAKANNPELTEAKKLNLDVLSMPEFIYQHSKNKHRIVIGGSHGKTTVTGMIMHVLRLLNKQFDYLVGSKVVGFDFNIKLSNEAPIMIIEGDEYLASTDLPIPKFIIYKPDVGLINGIDWDHANVFPSFENYLEQFKKFAEMVPSDGALFAVDEPIVRKILDEAQLKLTPIFYKTFPYFVENGHFFLKYQEKSYPLQIFGKHNMQNISAAHKICEYLDIDTKDFCEAMMSFRSANKRLEKLYENKNLVVFRDFAHAPSKVRATIDAVREHYPDRQLISVFELHTYSSLNQNFLPQYSKTMQNSDISIVFYSKHALEIKQLPDLNTIDIIKAFDQQNLFVTTIVNDIQNIIEQYIKLPAAIVLMSSGNFDNWELNINTIKEIVN